MLLNMNTTTIIILAVALIAIGLVRMMLTRHSRVAPPSVVREALDAGALIVDVRTPAEFGSDRFPGAVNIPLQDLTRRLGDFGDPGNAIVLYCNTGSRTAVAQAQLQRSGFTGVVNAGGLQHLRSAQS